MMSAASHIDSNFDVEMQERGNLENRDVTPRR
jgi:hypothetical protein